MFRHHRLGHSSILLAIALVAFTPLNTNAQLKQLRTSQGTTTPTLSSQSENLSLVQDDIWRWKTILGAAPAPAGWRVGSCNGGNGPLLCVLAKGKLLGTAEGSIYPLESLPDFQKMLAKAGITPGSMNIQSPQHKAQILVTLRAWATDYYALFAKDRQPEYGNKVTFSAQKPQEVSVGKLPGLRYGFTGLKRGGVHEQHLGYVAFDCRVLYVIKTGFDPLSETGTFKTLQTFRQFEPYLSRIVAGLRLPPPQTSQLTKPQLNKLQALNQKILVPAYVPTRFRVKDVVTKIEPGQISGASQYAILYQNPQDNSCFTIESASGGIGSGPELEYRLPIQSKRFGSEYGLNYDRPKEPLVRKQFLNPDLYTDWMEENGSFYRLSGAYSTRESHNQLNCRKDLSSQEALRVIESLTDLNLISEDSSVVVTEPVAELFRSTLSKLKQTTNLPILLPSKLPSALRLKMHIEVVDASGEANRYYVFLLSPCRCSANAFDAENGGKLELAELPSAKAVLLAKGITGYFKPSTCGGSCSTVQLEWQYRGVLYRTEFQPGRDAGEDEVNLLTMANSAIAAGPR